MTATGRYSCSWLKMPSMGFYIGTFTAMHSVLFLLFSLLSFIGLFRENYLFSIAIFMIVAIPFFTFFCNISMLFFGREYRKNSKSSYWDWTSLCYSLLILIDIGLLTAAFLTGARTSSLIIDRHFMFFMAFALNVFITFFLVSLPSALCNILAKRIVLIVGMLCHVCGVVLLWIAFNILMAHGCEDRSIASALFNMLPYRIFLNSGIPCFFSFLFLLSIVLTVFGYLSHLVIVASSSSAELKNAFSKPVIFFICLPIAVQAVAFVSSREMKITYSVMKPQFKVPLTVEGLEILYYAGESHDELFWNKFNSMAASLVVDDSENAFATISEMIDKVGTIPKCRRDFTSYISGKSSDLDSVFAYCVRLRDLMQKSIESKDAQEAAKMARRALKVDTLLLGDVYASAGLWHIFICKDILLPFAESGLVSAENLNEIKVALAANEKIIEGFFYNVSFWHTLCLCEMWKNMQSVDRIDVGIGNEMPVPSLNELFYVFPQQHCACWKHEARKFKGDNPVMLKMRDEAFEACRILSSF